MGDEENDLTGVWVLRSAHHEWVDTGEKILTYGDRPPGILHESGRMAAMITPSDQTAGGRRRCESSSLIPAAIGSRMASASLPTSISRGCRVGSEQVKAER